MTPRNTLTVLVLALLAGCYAWRSEDIRAIRSASNDSEHRLVVTGDRAVEIESSTVSGTEVSGRTVREWKISGAPIDNDALEDLEPEHIATMLGWVEVPHEPSFSGDVSAIRNSRVYEKQSGRTAAAIGFPSALGSGVLLIIILIAAAPPASCGRPLRVRGRHCITPLDAGTAWAEPLEIAPVPEAVREVLAEVWTEEAQAEHAAVAAFSKLSLELLALGAPPELVARANRAAIQEVQHAKLCFAVASAYAGRPLAPAPLLQALAGDTADLGRLARESLIDGCLREGLASEIAHMGADTARDPVVARVLRIQAKEEAQHAEHAWSIVEWAIERGGEKLRRELVAAIREHRRPRCDDLPEHGRVAWRQVKPRFEAIRARARARLEQTAKAEAA